MSALEREILEKFHQLQPAAKQRVRALIEQALDIESAAVPTFDYEVWFSDVETLRQQIRATHGDKLPATDVVGMLRDIRDGE